MIGIHIDSALICLVHPTHSTRFRLLCTAQNMVHNTIFTTFSFIQISIPCLLRLLVHEFMSWPIIPRFLPLVERRFWSKLFVMDRCILLRRLAVCWCLRTPLQYFRHWWLFWLQSIISSLPFLNITCAEALTLTIR